MDNKTKRRLKELFVKWGQLKSPQFTVDESLRDDPQFCALHRKGPVKWEFVALSFFSQRDQVFLEVAISDEEKFPLDTFPMEPSDQLTEGVLRFRAPLLWVNVQCDAGWIIRKAPPCHDDPFGVILGTPIGIFETPDAAMKDIASRIDKWVLPYFNSVID